MILSDEDKSSQKIGLAPALLLGEKAHCYFPDEDRASAARVVWSSSSRNVFLILLPSKELLVILELSSFNSALLGLTLMLIRLAKVNLNPSLHCIPPQTLKGLLDLCAHAVQALKEVFCTFDCFSHEGLIVNNFLCHHTELTMDFWMNI